MKKKSFVVLLLCLGIASIAVAQERVDITSFEEEEHLFSWAYSGGNIVESYVMFSDEIPGGVEAADGENVLYVEYDNAGSTWQWVQLNFPMGALDLTGMREIHMSVYFYPDSVPDPEDGFEMRLDLPGGANLGYQTTTTTGEWVEFVWSIDRLTSNERASEVSNFGGFIGPDPGETRGAMLIDNIYAVRPAGTVQVEEVPVYGFNELDPETGTPVGWTSADGSLPALGIGDVEPSEGSNYMEVYLGGGWIRNVQTADAMADFDRWAEVREIMVDVMVGPGFSGSWVQSALILQSGVNDEEGNPIEDIENVSGWDGYPELGYTEATEEWKLILWEVDMSKHAGAFENEGGWFTVSFTSNNDGSQEGAPVFFDNFRVAVPVETKVEDWSIF